MASGREAVQMRVTWLWRGTAEVLPYHVLYIGLFVPPLVCTDAHVLLWEAVPPRLIGQGRGTADILPHNVCAGADGLLLSGLLVRSAALPSSLLPPPVCV
jgi:hypothetical protein